MRVAIISGANGQDASYLSELLLSKGYAVVAFDRNIGEPSESLLRLIDQKGFTLECADVSNSKEVLDLVRKYEPHEFYNLAAQSSVGKSWDTPIETYNANFMGVLNCLEAIRHERPSTKFFQASSSEVYGDVAEIPQSEITKTQPRNPYGLSKYKAELLVQMYRESYEIFACCARSYNHESPRRGRGFVTRKITTHIAGMWKKASNGLSFEESKLIAGKLFEDALQKGIIEPIPLGNMKAERDWSHARDVVDGIYLMMQQDVPDDFVFASGISHSIEDLLTAAFGYVGIKDWSNLVVVDPKFFRPVDVNTLLGNSDKAKKILGWKPKFSFEELVEDMMAHDISSLAGR